MPRRRYHDLDPEKRVALLRAATAEFAAHGYRGASQNRIIERAGISKGALYYYFEDKRDLFVTVLQSGMADFMEYIGPLGPAEDADTFWDAIGALYGRSIAYYVENPEAAQLTRSVARAVSGGEEVPWLAELRDMTRTWIGGLVRTGRRLGAVRDDIPEPLLITLLLAVSESLDVWCATKLPSLSADDLTRLTPLLTRLLRRFAAPAPEDEIDREAWASIATEVQK